MTTHAEGCGLEPFLKFVSREWVSHVIFALATNGMQRFGVLRRAMPRKVSARVLSSRLKALVQQGYVSRRVVEGRVRTVEYSLTDEGRRVDDALRDAHRRLRL